jgi:hypothetical protein
MTSPRYPVMPVDVAALTTAEFAFDLEWNGAPSLDEVCRRFGGDANRALVWLVRVRALKAWCAREGMAQWLHEGSRTPHDACEVAAGFQLNDRWEFDAEAFCMAVDVSAGRRSW